VAIPRLFQPSRLTHTPQCYDSFKSYLHTIGFLLYPSEFDCVYSEHPFVDIAARMGSFYWAFEYKSESDSVSRGLEQLKCYSKWFDYIVMVSERTFNHRTSDTYWAFKNIGAGIWFYDPAQGKCIQSKNPMIQRPESQNRTMVIRRFSSVFRKRDRLNPSVGLGHQTDLLAFVS
jgi:hypothetical protein